MFLRLRDDEGNEGWGEHAASARVTGQGFEAVANECRQLVANPDWVDRLLEDASNLPGGVPRPGARNALVSAWLDLVGKRRAEPTWETLNLPEGGLPTSVTVGIMGPEAAARAAVRFAEQGFDVIKLKLGGEHDERVLSALRDALPDIRLRVDANEGWSFTQAQRIMPVLARHEVELVEQPVKRSDVQALTALTGMQTVPVFLDESVLDSVDLFPLVSSGAGNGVVIKLAKCGGLYEARRMVKIAKAHDWQVMLGCMIESSVGIAAAAHLVGVADHADLDGNLLVEDDLGQGPLHRNGAIHSPAGPGLGATPQVEKLQAL